MSTYEAISLMIMSSMFIVSLITLIISILKVLLGRKK